MTKLETGCSGSDILYEGFYTSNHMYAPSGLFSENIPRPPYNPFSYPVCGVRLLTVKPLFHLF